MKKLILTLLVMFVAQPNLAFGESKWFTKKSDTKKTTVTVEGTTSLVDLGKYESINYPEEMQKKLAHRDSLRVAGMEVLHRFIKKKSTLGMYPNKLMEAMAWMEVLYNEKIKNPKTIKVDDIKGLLEARNSMRKSVGLGPEDSAQEAIDTFWVMSILLSRAKYEKQEVEPALLERKKALKNLQAKFDKAKKENLEKAGGAFTQFQKSVNQAIQEYNNEIKNLSASNNELVQSIDKVIEKIDESIQFTQEAIQNNNVGTTLSALELLNASIAETASTIPSAAITTFDHVDMEATFSEEQLNTLSKMSENKFEKEKNDTLKLITTVKYLEDNGFKASDYAEEVGSMHSSFSSQAGGFVNYSLVKRINKSYVLGNPTLLQPLMPGGVYRPGMVGMLGAVIGPQLFFSPSSSSVEEVPRGPLEFWETDEYREDFYEAYDRYKWPWMNQDNPITGEEFKKQFPKWPDGVVFSTGYNWESLKYKGPPIDWPGLNPDGTCTGRRLMCNEQYEYQLHKLNQKPTIANVDYSKLNEPVLDLNNLTTESIANVDTQSISQITEEVSSSVSDINTESVAQVSETIASIDTESISESIETVSSSDSIQGFIEEANNIVEMVSDMNQSISVESITESGLSNFVNSEALENSFESINQQMEALMESTEQIKEELLNQDLEGYLNSPGMELPCTPTSTYDWATGTWSEFSC